MQKSSTSKNKRPKRRAALIQETALIAGTTDRSVRRVLAGDQNNEPVFELFMTLNEEYDRMIAEQSHNWCTIFNRNPQKIA